jgi:translation initiation factor 4B
VSNVRLVRDRENDRPKGFGYVEFSSKDGLLRALDLNGSQLAGRNVRINVAEPRRLP